MIVKHLNKKEKSQIKVLHRKGFNNREIAKKLGRSHQSIPLWLKRFGLKGNRPKGQPIQMIDTTHAICSKCKKIKLIQEFFWIRKKGKYKGRQSYCKDCKHQQILDRENSSLEIFLARKYMQKRNRAKRDKILFFLSKQDYFDLYYRQNGKCFYTDEKMLVCRAGTGNHKNNLSLDRLDPKGSYSKSNSVFCLQKINFIKSNLNLLELQKWIPKWYKRIIKLNSKG